MLPSATGRVMVQPVFAMSGMMVLPVERPSVCYFFCFAPCCNVAISWCCESSAVVRVRVRGSVVRVQTREAACGTVVRTAQRDGNNQKACPPRRDLKNFDGRPRRWAAGRFRSLLPYLRRKAVSGIPLALPREAVFRSREIDSPISASVR